jgi:autotransporter-associated beta strand protein
MSPRFLSSCLLALVAAACAHAQIPAFPGAEGYGAYATGGRGGDVYHVTNLSASGTGSFADAIATVPAAGRTIVFDVSGYIRLPSGSNGTRMTASKVTIAGQTAPGDGIGFYNNFFRVSGDDIIIRHLRFRHGKYGSGGDCIDLDSGCLNAVLDHVSMQFSTDENMSSFGSPPENLTLQYSLNAWGLESHSCGGLWDQNHATSHHNLWAHNHTRNPKARPNGLLEWINNVTFDWDIGFIMGDSQSVQSWKANVINNYFVCPPGNTQSKALVKGNLATNNLPNFTIFLSGNLIDNDGDGLLNGVDKGYSIVEGSLYDPAESPAPAPGAYRHYRSASAITGSTAGVVTDSPLTAYKKVVSSAGALRLDASYTGTLRDEVDTILLTKLTTQSRGHVTRESDTGAANAGFGFLNSTPAPIDTDRDGMPDNYENALGWNSAVQDHNTTVTGTTFLPAGTPAGYTRLEEYLHFLAVPHLTIQKDTSTSPDIDLTRFTSGFSQSPVFTISNVTGGTLTQSGTGGKLVHFTAQSTAGRGGFLFTVTDADGSTWTQQFAICVANTGLPSDLTWQGDGTSNTWDTTTNNWLKAGVPTPFSSGDRVLFSDTGSKSPAISVPSSVVTGSFDVNSSGTYTFSGAGAISSSSNLTKRGSGELIISNTGANSFANVSLEEGLLTVNVSTGLGSAAIDFTGGSLKLGPASNSTISSPLKFSVPSTITPTSQHTESGSWTGTNQTVTINGGSVLWTVAGSWSGFTGRVQFGNSSVRMRLNNTSNVNYGSTAVALDLGGNDAQFMNRNGITVDIGSLESTGASTQLQGTQSGTTASTYSIGALNTNTTFAGIIANGGSATTNITKVGTGTLTLTGASTYTGTTTLSAGGLRVSGSLGATAVSVNSGATLAGAGTIGGSVAVNSGGKISPGNSTGAAGNLTVGSLALTTATLPFDLSSNPASGNDHIQISSGGGLSITGTQTFQFNFINGELGAGTYNLIDTTGTLTASSATLASNLPSGTRQTFTLSRNSSGTAPGFISLVVTGSAASLVWKGTAGGSLWDQTTTASWLNASTANSFYNFDAVTFDDTAATGLVNLSGSVAPRTVTVNNSTLAYTFGGTGTLDGSTTLIKNGSGTLTFANSGANTFTGGVLLNAGTIVFADDFANSNAFGTGTVTFANNTTLTMYNNASGDNNAYWNMVVPSAVTATLNADSRVALYGSLTGSGTLNLRIPYVRTHIYGDWSAFTGTINVTTDGDGGQFRFGTNYSYAGFPSAAIILPNLVTAQFIGIVNASGTTLTIGELSGTSSSGLQGGATAGRPLTYRIGGKNTSATFAGNISEQTPGSTNTSIVKTGTGTWTLSGSATHAGSTTVEQGTLHVSGLINNTAALTVASGATLSLANASITVDSVQIQSGATLTGSGTINNELVNDGTVTVANGGTLTITGDVTNTGVMRLTAGSTLVNNGTFINGGTLDIMTAGGSLPGSFVNNGTLIDASAAKLKSHQVSGTAFTLKIDGYSGHSYKLQTTTDLTTWTDIETRPGVTGQELTFTHDAGAFARRFYRIVVQ